MSLTTLNINNPPLGNTTPYTGFYYAFYGSGGFVMDQCFNTIKLIQETPLLQYDVTKALQVRFDVRTFNEKIGLYKDASNIHILSSDFNSVNDNFPVDSITISAAEFVNGMTADYVISVGTYSTLYSDFVEYVNTYFGYAGGFSSLFSLASQFDINNGVFDASAFINIITESTIDPSGANVKALTGSITISNINSLLKYAINGNVFNNRNPQKLTGNASDPNSYLDASSNYGMADGFVAGDLIFVPYGTTIGLHLVIDSEGLNPLNNLGPSNVNSLTQTMDASKTCSSQYYDASGNLRYLSDFSETSTATTTNIDRILTAPLLIKLDNLSTSSSG